MQSACRVLLIELFTMFPFFSSTTTHFHLHFLAPRIRLRPTYKLTHEESALKTFLPNISPSDEFLPYNTTNIRSHEREEEDEENYVVKPLQIDLDEIRVMNLPCVSRVLFPACSVLFLAAPPPDIPRACVSVPAHANLAPSPSCHGASWGLPLMFRGCVRLPGSHASNY